MNITYSRTRSFLTSDLPGVYLEPPLTVEYLTQPSIGMTRLLITWESGEYQDSDMLIELAAQLIVSVTNHEGERYEMGTVENIRALSEATELGIDLIVILVRGWTTLVGMERLTNKKKSSQSSKVSASKNNSREPAAT